MRRRTFDFVVSWVGVLLVIVLAVAGGLLIWAYSFTNNQVTSQLSAQKIVFPTTSNAEFKALPKADQAAMAPYAGQLMTTGAQARVYADNFIAYHLTLVAGGKTYSQVSAEALAMPTNAVLAAQADTLFKGTTLRGLLLNAYAFWQIGQIALIAGIIALCAALIMLILTVLGFLHVRRTGPEAELLGLQHQTGPGPRRHPLAAIGTPNWATGSEAR